MKPIDRRAFINTLAGALAAGFAGAVTESCTTLRAGYLGGKYGSGDIEAKLARLDKNSRELRRSKMLRQASSVYGKSGCTTELLPDALETLLVAGMFGDLGENERSDPRVQKRVEQAMPVMTDAFLGMATYMESLDSLQRSSVRRTLNEQPDIMSEFQVRFDAASREHDIPPERLEHFHSMFNQCVWRLRNQDPSLLIDECVAMVDKEGSRCGISPAERRAFAAAGGINKMREAGVAGPLNEDDDRLASAEPQNDSTLAWDPEARLLLLQRQDEGRAQVRTGGILMGIGAVALTLGLVIGFATLGNVYAVIFGCVGGAVCLIVGLILIIVGLYNKSH